MFAPQIEALEDSYRVIAYNQRGRTNRWAEAYDLGDLANDCRGRTYREPGAAEAQQRGDPRLPRFELWRTLRDRRHRTAVANQSAGMRLLPLS